MMVTFLLSIPGGPVSPLHFLAFGGQLAEWRPSGLIKNPLQGRGLCQGQACKCCWSRTCPGLEGLRGCTQPTGLRPLPGTRAPGAGTSAVRGGSPPARLQPTVTTFLYRVASVTALGAQQQHLGPREPQKTGWCPPLHQA
jgi:hypothetical protein